VSVRIATRIAVQRLDEHHRRHERWPQLLRRERSDERDRRLRARCPLPRVLRDSERSYPHYYSGSLVV
jgi:hypothetical protein